jgi:hypothetical protein
MGLGRVSAVVPALVMRLASVVVRVQDSAAASVARPLAALVTQPVAA